MKIIKIDEMNFKIIDGEKEIIVKRKENEDFIRLEENSLGRKFLQISKFKDCNEVELKKINRSEKSEKCEKSEVFNWVDFLNDDELSKYNELKKIGEDRIEKEKIRRENPKYKEMVSIKSKFDELIKIGFISKESEDYKKICQMIENFKIED